MQRRIFIGISLPEDVKKRLVQKVEKWKELPVKWSLPDNFHITLSFLGFVDDSSLVDICARVKEAADGFESFDIDFEKIKLAPDPENPKMIWLSGTASEKLRKLQSEIERSLDIFVSEKKTYRPHMALGKIIKNKWGELENIPKIEENFRISIPVESADVFESKIEKGRTKFNILESCQLK